MVLMNGSKISADAVKFNLKRLTNQVYKLLPLREEGGNWKLSLQTIMEELSGMNFLIFNQETLFFSILCKLQGLQVLETEEDFQTYRRTIFDCLSLIGRLADQCMDTKI